MKHIKLFERFILHENRNILNYKGANRIILIGPPTIGKSTVAQELSSQLGIEVAHLDELQEEFGYGRGKELELVKYVLSPKFRKYNTPSILDFGGGHVYNKGVEELLSDYPNIFLLMPTKDRKKSDELLRKGNEERWKGFIDEIIRGLKSGKHKHTKEKESKLIDKLEKMKRGGGGKFNKEDFPDTEETRGWGGLNLSEDWNKTVPLSPEENKKNMAIAKHIIFVYHKNGRRRNRKSIAKEIIKLLHRE